MHCEERPSSMSTAGTITQPSEFETDWINLPQIIIETIYEYLDVRSRGRASSTCASWRRAFYAPCLWRKLHINVETKRDLSKLRFFASVARYATSVAVIWKYRNQFSTRYAKQIDIEHMKAIRILMSELEEAIQLNSLKLQFENAWSHQSEFICHVKKCLSSILEKNTVLEFLSFGGNMNIAPLNVIDCLNVQSFSKLTELHISSFDKKSLFSSEKLFSEGSFVYDSSPFYLYKNPRNVTCMTSLKELSIGFGHVTHTFLEALNSRKNSDELTKLNISVFSHICCGYRDDSGESASNFESVYHPDVDQWSMFARSNPKVKVSLTFAGSISGICRGLEVIKPGVSVLKLLEYHSVDPDELGLIFLWHRETLKTLVHCCAWDPVMLDNGDELWPFVSQCLQLENIVFIGHYIPDEAVVFIAHYFEDKLKNLIASRGHLISFAEASDYMIPISAGRYSTIKNRISEILGKHWEAHIHIPLSGFYFCEGKDDSFYETGSIDAITP